MGTAGDDPRGHTTGLGQGAQALRPGCIILFCFNTIFVDFLMSGTALLVRYSTYAPRGTGHDDKGGTARAVSASGEG